MKHIPQVFSVLYYILGFCVPHFILKIKLIPHKPTSNEYYKLMECTEPENFKYLKVQFRKKSKSPPQDNILLKINNTIMK